MKFSEFISESSPKEQLKKWVESQKFKNDNKGNFQVDVDFKDLNDDFTELKFEVSKGTGSSSYKGEMNYEDAYHIVDAIKKKFGVKFDVRELNDLIKISQSSNQGHMKFFTIRIHLDSLA